MDEDMRQNMLMAAFSDKSSAMYQGMIAVLRDCEASERRARMVRSQVLIPFHVDDGDVVALETQFGVSIKKKWSPIRSVLTSRVAAFIHLIDSALMEYAGGCGRSMLIVDGDLMTLVTSGLEGKLVERTHASARLSAGYFREDEQLRSFSSVRTGQVNITADVVNRELVGGGGEHFWPKVREKGPKVNSIVVNHFKTPVGPRQLAYLASCRGAVVFGSIFFQPEMLTQDEGELRCFPGRFYVDRDLDMITLVPSTDATMSLSHPFSAWKEIILNNTITVGGREYLCEKYKSVMGVVYYTMVPVDGDFEAPEVLRSCYFDKSLVDVVEISHPVVTLSKEGVPVGVGRSVSKILKSRLDEVLFRLMNSASSIIQPSEAFTVLMDYNNTVVQSLDHVKIADRIDYATETKLALALALHVNWTRHSMRGTLNVLLDAIKLRYSVKDAYMYKLAYIALAAWWHKPRVKGENHDELPVTKVVDWCGTDFGVVMRDADPWIEIVQTAGLAVETQSKEYPWFPVVPVPRSSEWLKVIVAKAREAMCSGKEGKADSKVSSNSTSLVKSGSRGFMPLGKSATTTSVAISNIDLPIISRPVELTDLKKVLKAKMVKEQGAVNERMSQQFRNAYDCMRSNDTSVVPVVDVDPIAAMKDDMLMCNGGPFERDVIKTGYRIAEVDVHKNTEGSFAINDAKRLIPKGRWARRPVVDAGVEGIRVSSQAALMGALFKRNIGVPANRGTVNLDELPAKAVQRVIDVCYVENWETILEKHLNSGMWEPNDVDIEDFLGGIDEKKVKGLLDEFFLEGTISLHRWLLLVKGKIKAGRETGAALKVDHSQTIMYLDESSVNAMYSSMVRRLKKCMNECLRPEVRLSPECSEEEHEEWYNSLQGIRESCIQTYSYGVDIKCYDRSQEHVGLNIDLEWYRRHGLSEKRLKLWEQTHGVKKATSMMFGVVLHMVLGGISGLWKTLIRNTIVNVAALIVSTDIHRADIVTMDIKGDDADLETKRPLEVETATERLGMMFNLSSKFNTNNVRYMCKSFRLYVNGKWCFIPDPWARTQSVCTVFWVGNHEDTLKERWISLRADLRHYDDGSCVDAVAEAAQQYYHLPRPMYGAARALTAIKNDFSKYMRMFGPPELID